LGAAFAVWTTKFIDGGFGFGFGAGAGADEELALGGWEEPGVATMALLKSADFFQRL
jgi:hypothetical protein